MPSHWPQPPFQLQSIFKTNAYKYAGPGQALQKEGGGKKPTPPKHPTAEFQHQLLLLPGAKAHTAAGSVMLWSSSVSIPTSSYTSMDRLSRVVAPAWQRRQSHPHRHHCPGAELGLGTYEELLLAFGVPLQDGLQQLSRLVRQGNREGCGVATPSCQHWAAPLQLLGTVPRPVGASQASTAQVTAWEQPSLMQGESALFPEDKHSSAGPGVSGHCSNTAFSQGIILVPPSLPQMHAAGTALPAPQLQHSPEVSPLSTRKALSSNKSCSPSCSADPTSPSGHQHHPLSPQDRHCHPPGAAHPPHSMAQPLPFASSSATPCSTASARYRPANSKAK